jgi:cytochrome o ubiquinol oxidase operon protein cyoD
VGVLLAFVLTAIPFGLVAARLLAPAPCFAIIAITAIAQIFVHLRYFLHLDLAPSSQDRLIALVFTAILIVIMMGGSIWIMFDLHGRMM